MKIARKGVLKQQPSIVMSYNKPKMNLDKNIERNKTNFRLLKSLFTLTIIL